MNLKSSLFKSEASPASGLAGEKIESLRSTAATGMLGEIRRTLGRGPRIPEEMRGCKPGIQGCPEGSGDARENCVRGPLKGLVEGRHREMNLEDW